MNNVFNINPKIKYTGGSKGWIGDIPKFKYDLSKIKKLGWESKMTSDEAIKTTFKLLHDQWT
jgi:UDP-glucose 4-epimerase